MENDNAAYRNDLVRRKDLFIYTNATEEQIAHIPAVDAVEVVRCRECRHYKPSKYNASTAHYCGVIDGFPKEDWFCADGHCREDSTDA